jgi:AAA family ATP:ADP antiporter
VIWRGGDGSAAAGILLFAQLFHTQDQTTAVQVGWVSLLLILVWFAAAVKARREYVGTLRESVRQHRLDAERAIAPVLDRSTTEIFAANLNAADAKEILYALSLFEVGAMRAAHPAIRALLDHPSAEVRCKAVSILAGAGDRSILPKMEQLLLDADLEVRTEALLYLTHHAHIDPLARIQQLGDFPDFSIRSALVAFLARPGETQNLEAARIFLDAMVREAGPEGKRTRLEAARLLERLPDEFEDQLRILLDDPDPEVCRHAVAACGNLRKRPAVLRIIDRLGQPEVAPAAAEALAKFGDRIVGTLRDHLSDTSIPMAVRREIPGVLLLIGTQAAERILVESLLEPDAMLRMRILSALNKLHQTRPELELDRQMVETVLAAEILGHYRSYQLLGTLGGNLESDDPVIRALRESMDQEVERIFRLLSLLFPHYDFHSAYVGLQSRNAVVHDNALEFLDNILKPQLRNVLVPLLDSDVSIAERMRLAAKQVGAMVAGPEEAVAALVASDDAWLKSCGAYAIGSLGLKSLEPQLDGCLEHPDPLLRETARQAKLRLAALAEPAGV